MLCVNGLGHSVLFGVRMDSSSVCVAWYETTGGRSHETSGTCNRSRVSGGTAPEQLCAWPSMTHYQ